jgi:DNA gyrase/topoisomerase IV subunit A
LTSPLYPLSTSEINSDYIPDLIERGLYKTLYALILSLLDELFAHMKINIIGDQILFHLEPGSLNPNSLFYLSESDVPPSSSMSAGSVTPSSSDNSRQEYQTLLQEEKRCQQILQNIQRKLEVLRPALADDELESETVKGAVTAAVTDYSLFFTAIGFFILVLSK